MSTPARRPALDWVAAPGDHPGLALGPYIRTLGDAAALDAHYQQIAALTPPPLYRAAYDRWLRTLAMQQGEAGGAALASFTFTVAGRLIVGLGAESVRETALALHRLYGTPIIPAQALTGLGRRYFAASLARDLEPGARRLHEQVLFGQANDGREGRGAEMAGFVAYCDAWYIPGSAPDDRPLVRDVITVHHPDYYGSGGRGRAPWDFDDPNPTPFLSARGSYHIAVLGPNGDWAAFASELLRRALTEWGIGGKTASGYGRAAGEMGEVRPDPAAAPLPPAGHPLLGRFRELTTINLGGKGQPLYGEALRLAEPARRQALVALRVQLERGGFLARWGNREWVRALLAELERPPAVPDG